MYLFTLRWNGPRRKDALRTLPGAGAGRRPFSSCYVAGIYKYSRRSSRTCGNCGKPAAGQRWPQKACGNAGENIPPIVHKMWKSEVVIHSPKGVASLLPALRPAADRKSRFLAGKSPSERSADRGQNGGCPQNDRVWTQGCGKTRPLRQATLTAVQGKLSTGFAQSGDKFSRLPQKLWIQKGFGD